MAKLPIKTFPDKALKEKTAPVTDFDSDLQKLIDDMIETMYAAPGVGLAANQIGISRQLVVIDASARDEDSSLIVLINPEILCAEGTEDSEEGCLSLPEYTTVIKRAKKIKVKGLDREGEPFEIESDGFLAKVLQHEIDHLNGMLLIDRIGRIKREFFNKRYAREQTAGKK
jgi:peptide deformylase